MYKQEIERQINFSKINGQRERKRLNGKKRKKEKKELRERVVAVWLANIHPEEQKGQKEGRWIDRKTDRRTERETDRQTERKKVRKAE
jgi:hypothetical protein